MRSQRGRPSAATHQYPRDSLIAGMAYPEPKTCGKKYSPVTKALPLRRSNTDCEAGMNREASVGVSADLKPQYSFLSAGKWSRGVRNSAALKSSARRCSRQSLRWGNETVFTSGCN